MIIFPIILILFQVLLERSIASPVPDISISTGLNLPLSALPAPPNGTIIRYIALGLGTQNYTCTASSPTPVPNGAKAILYSAERFLKNHPEMSTSLTAQALSFPCLKLNENGKASFPHVLGLPFLGEHYFNSNLQPVFDLTMANAELQAKVVSDIGAPPDAYPGINGTGAVDWLYLMDASGGSGATRGGVVGVYRILTAGGKSPRTCAGSQSSIIIDYSAIYVFIGPRNN